MALFGNTQSGMGVGMPVPNLPRTNAINLPPATPESAFAAAVPTQAMDYDRIMQQYRDYMESLQSRQVDIPGVTPQMASFTPSNTNYQSSGALGNVTNQLNTMAETGGYSESDVNNIRARATSPIRAAYATAQRNTERQRALSGGYSPNFGAVQAKLAREQSGIMSDASTNVNAAIAQLIASGKKDALATLAPLAAKESDFNSQVALANSQGQQRVNETNTANINQAGQFNSELATRIADMNRAAENDFNTKKLQGIEGQKSLYGTTPALASTFGNQALQSQGQKDSYNLNRGNQGLNMISNLQSQQPRNIPVFG